MSSASGTCSPPRTTTGAGPATSGASSSSYCRRTPRIRTTTSALPSASAAIPASSSRAGLPSRQSAPLARAESRSVSLVESRVSMRCLTRGPRPGSSGTAAGVSGSPGGPGSQWRDRAGLAPASSLTAVSGGNRTRRSRSAPRGVQALQEQKDLVLPTPRELGAGPGTRPDPHAVHAAEVAVDEGVAGLGPVGRAVGEAQVPGAARVPRVLLEEVVLVRGRGLNASPLAAQH